MTPTDPPSPDTALSDPEFDALAEGRLSRKRLTACVPGRGRARQPGRIRQP